MSTTTTETFVTVPTTTSTLQALALAQSDTLDSLSSHTLSEPATPLQSFSDVRDAVASGSSDGHGFGTASYSGPYDTQETRRFPLANAKGLVIIIPDDSIDVQAESAMYEDFDIVRLAAFCASTSD